MFPLCRVLQRSSIVDSPRLAHAEHLTHAVLLSIVNLTTHYRPTLLTLVLAGDLELDLTPTQRGQAHHSPHQWCTKASSAAAISLCQPPSSASLAPAIHFSMSFGGRPRWMLSIPSASSHSPSPWSARQCRNCCCQSLWVPLSPTTFPASRHPPSHRLRVFLSLYSGMQTVAVEEKGLEGQTLVAPPSFLAPPA